MYQLLFHLGLVKYFPIVCGVIGVLHVISVSFIIGNRIPNTKILVCLGIAPTIIKTILHILVVHYSLDVVTSVSLLLGRFSTTFKLPIPQPNIISDSLKIKNIVIKNIVMTKDNASSGVGQGETITFGTVSGSGTNNASAAAAVAPKY